MTRAEESAAVPYETRPLGQSLDFLRVLWAINHGLATTSRYMKSKYGVTGRQRLIIQVVNEFPGISAGDLAKVLHLVSQHVDRRAAADEPARVAPAAVGRPRPSPPQNSSDIEGQAHEPSRRWGHRSGCVTDALERFASKIEGHPRGSGPARR